MKLCKDCKHYNPIMNGNHIIEHLCKRRTPKHDLITGAVINTELDCEYERDYSWAMSRLEKKCGREGRFFEPKEVKP